MDRSFDVTGINSVTFEFWTTTAGLDYGEYVFAYISPNGSDYTLCYQGKPTSYTKQGCVDFDVSGTNTVYVELGVYSNRTTEYGYFDDVSLIGDGAIDVNCNEIYDRYNHGVTFYEYNPPYYDPIDMTDDFTFTTPEAQEMDSDTLQSGFDSLNSHPKVFSVIVARNGNIVGERYYNGSASYIANNIHSASKTVLLSVIAHAVEDGYISDLSDDIADYLTDYSAKFTGNRADITVKHLMEMRSGIEWEDGVTEESIDDEVDWVGAILDQSVPDVPGTVFEYQSGNTHLLSAVIQEATAENYCEYAHEKLLKPLGIYAEHWGRDPQGVYSGGYNLYMTPREMLKFGFHMMDSIKGASSTYNDIIQDSVLENAHGETWHYGDLWWIKAPDLDGYDAFNAWGYGGQYIFLVPDLDLILVATHDTTGTLQYFDSAAFMSAYVIQAIEDYTP
ncbi:beta-lactamase family protein [bacterium]|nr:beta-lactamase family protein [bacterium]